MDRLISGLINTTALFNINLGWTTWAVLGWINNQLIGNGVWISGIFWIALVAINLFLAYCDYRIMRIVKEEVER